MTATSRRIRWPAAALAAGLALVGGAAAGYTLTRPPDHDYGTVPPPGAYYAGSPRPGLSSSGTVVAGRQAPPVVTAVNVPVRLRVPAIGVNAAVLPTGVETGGWLAIPPDPSDVGWWAAGGFPGAPAGAVILAGHIDSAARGPGALYRLQDLRPGDAITISAGRRDYRYQVAALRAYPKGSLPASAVFGQQVTARLVIVSCGGSFDARTGHYLDNIVAYAVPAARP